jgi:hypothetical protein
MPPDNDPELAPDARFVRVRPRPSVAIWTWGSFALTWLIIAGSSVAIGILAGKSSPDLIDLFLGALCQGLVIALFVALLVSAFMQFREWFWLVLSSVAVGALAGTLVGFLFFEHLTDGTRKERLGMAIVFGVVGALFGALFGTSAARDLSKRRK